VSLPDAPRDSASRCVGLFTGAVDFFLKRKHGGVLANQSERRLRRSAETEGALLGSEELDTRSSRITSNPSLIRLWKAGRLRIHAHGASYAGGDQIECPTINKTLNV
jgi:hypothetical protein